jgi:hypothetical protein
MTDPASRARQRALDRVAGAAAAPSGPDALFAAVFGELERVMPVTSACWHLTDPLTGVLTRTGAIGEPPGTYEEALGFEFLEDEYATMADVVRRSRPVAVLSHETGGEPARSARYRDMLEPAGTADELRAAFVDAFGRWGSIVLFASGRLDGADADLLMDMSAVVAQGLRLSVARAPAPEPADGAPAVAVVGADDALEAADARARERLDELVAGSGATGLPGVVHVLAAQARRRDPRAPRERGSGRGRGVGTCSTRRRSTSPPAAGWRWSSSRPPPPASSTPCSSPTVSRPASARSPRSSWRGSPPTRSRRGCTCRPGPCRTT